MISLLAWTSCSSPAKIVMGTNEVPKTRYQLPLKVDSEAGKETVSLNTESLEMCEWFREKALNHGSWVDIKAVGDCRKKTTK